MTENAFAPPRANVDVRTGPQALWDMTFKDVRKLYLASSNIQALGVLYGLGAILLVLISWGFATAPADYQRGPVTIWPLFAIMVIPSIAAAITSFTRPGWARGLGIALCVLNLVNIPLGTLFAIAGLVAYARGGRLFGPDRLSHRDVADVYKQRKKDKL